MTPLIFAKCAEEYYTAGGTLANALKLAHRLSKAQWVAEQAKRREALKKGNEARYIYKDYKRVWSRKRKRTSTLKNFRKG